MSKSDEYRRRAAEADQDAEKVDAQAFRDQYRVLAQGWRELANREEADHGPAAADGEGGSSTPVGR